MVGSLEVEVSSSKCEAFFLRIAGSERPGPGCSARLDLQTVALHGGIDLPGPGVDSSSQREGGLQPVAAEPGAAVENLPAAVIVEDHGLFRRGREKGLLGLLGEELAGVDPDRLVLLAGAEIEEPDRLSGVETGLEGARFDEHLPVALVTGEQLRDGAIHLDLVTGADLRESLIVAIGAGLAAPDVIGREEGAARAGKAGEEIFHAIAGGDLETGD